MSPKSPVPGLDIRLPLIVNAGRMIEARLDDMLTYEPFLYDAEAVHSLHQMRISAKRLRYTLEIFLDCIRDQTPYAKLMDRTVEAVKKLQEILGEIHDCDVLMPRLHRQSVRLMRKGYGEDADGNEVAGVHRVDLDGCEGLLALCHRIRDRRDLGFTRLSEAWERFNEDQLFDTMRTAMVEIGRHDAEGTSPDTIEATSRRSKSQVVAEVRKKRHEKEHVVRHHKNHNA